MVIFTGGQPVRLARPLRRLALGAVRGRDEAVGRPIAHPAVLLGHVARPPWCGAPLVRRPSVAGDALAAVEALDGAGRQPDVDAQITMLSISSTVTVSAVRS